MSVSRVCYFFCSKCNHVFKKEDNLRGWKIAVMTPDSSPSIAGTLTCQYCGNVIQSQEIYSGNMMFPGSIGQICLHLMKSSSTEKT